MSFSASPTVITWPIGIPARFASHATARPFDTPGATNSRNRGCETVAPARPANVRRASSISSIGRGGSPTAMTFETGLRTEAARSPTMSASGPR